MLTDDQVLVKESNMYKHDGRKERGYDIIDRIGFNFRMTEMQAAVGVAQIERLQEICQQKLAVYHQYQKGFNDGTAWADLNADGIENILDIVQLVENVFKKNIN